MNHIHVRIHRWVIWSLVLGVVGGAVALLNIFMHHLSRGQEDAILVVGLVHWVLGGLVCWALGSVTVEAPPRKREEPQRIEEEREWHPGSDFLQPGGRKSLLPPRF